MEGKKYTARTGFLDGLSIAFAYFPVAFAFGLFAVAQGLTPWQTVLISMLNVTSAGQLASVPIFVGTGTYLEMALTQFMINLRYALTSITLSQKLDKDIKLLDRYAIGFMNTDEVFGVCAEKEGKLSREYLYSLISPPYLGWTLGTVFGAYAGTLLPIFIVSILGFAVYGMFFSILLPAAKKNKNVFLCEVLSGIISCVIFYVPALSFISSGFRIIITATMASALIALFFPIPIKTEDDGEGKCNE